MTFPDLDTGAASAKHWPARCGASIYKQAEADFRHGARFFENLLDRTHHRQLDDIDSSATSSRLFRSASRASRCGQQVSGWIS